MITALEMIVVHRQSSGFPIGFFTDPAQSTLVFIQPPVLLAGEPEVVLGAPGMSR
jgi:hypothetical protein